MHALRTCLLLFLVPAATAACDGFQTGKEDPPATTIITAFANPDTVAVGEQTKLTVIIRDSLKTGFRYDWHGIVGVPRTEVPFYIWTVDAEPGSYVLAVQVSRPGYTAVGRNIPITVAKPASPGD